MYPLIETICIVDGDIQNLNWHQKRYEASYAQLFSKTTSASLTEGIVIPKKFRNGLCKLRISYNTENRKIEFENYVAKQVNSLKIIAGDHLEYGLKYANRKQLNKLLESKENCDDILIIKNGKVTDASYANIVFTDGTKWFTPTSPLLKGTCRARLLAEKKIEAIDISVTDISHFLGFRLINAMNDLNTNNFVEIENIVP